MWLLVLLCSCCLHQIASAIPSFAAECLREHNQIRARHGAPPLQWDSTLARHAQQWADKLNKMDAGSIHDRRTREGENIADGPNMSCKQGVADWYEEYCEYYNEDYCSFPPARHPYGGVMHFTQLVWKKTTKMGAAISGDYLVVRYSPKGNSYRHYASNVQCASQAFNDKVC